MPVNSRHRTCRLIDASPARSLSARLCSQLCQSGAHLTIPGLLALLAQSAELSHIHIRRGEKKLLNAINHAKVHREA